MEDHIMEINKLCRFCKSKPSVPSYKLSTYSEALNFIYSEDVNKDDSYIEAFAKTDSVVTNLHPVNKWKTRGKYGRWTRSTY